MRRTAEPRERWSNGRRTNRKWELRCPEQAGEYLGGVERRLRRYSIVAKPLWWEVEGGGAFGARLEEVCDTEEEEL